MTAYVTTWLSRMQAETGNRASIEPWIEKLAAQGGAETGLQRWMNKFSLIRLFVALQRWDEALNLADDLNLAAASAKSIGRQIEALMLQAEIYWQTGRPEQSFACLCQSLNLAEPRGYARVFLDESASLQRLLAAIIKWPALPIQQKTFASRLLTNLPIAASGDAAQKSVEMTAQGWAGRSFERPGN